MKTNIIIFSIALIIGLIGSPLQAQSGKAIKQNREVKNFTSIKLQGVGDIHFTQGEDCSLRIEGPKEYVDKVTVSVNNGKLVIGYKKKNNNSKNVKFYISAPSLSRVDIEGVGAFNCAKKLQLKDIELNMEGVGSIKVADLECKSLRTHLEGVGSVKINVNCETLVANASGVGSITLSGYAKEASIKKDGIGSVNTRKLTIGNE